VLVTSNIKSYIVPG